MKCVQEYQEKKSLIRDLQSRIQEVEKQLKQDETKLAASRAALATVFTSEKRKTPSESSDTTVRRVRTKHACLEAKAKAKSSYWWMMGAAEDKPIPRELRCCPLCYAEFLREQLKLALEDVEPTPDNTSHIHIDNVDVVNTNADAMTLRSQIPTEKGSTSNNMIRRRDVYRLKNPLIVFHNFLKKSGNIKTITNFLFCSVDRWSQHMAEHVPTNSKDWMLKMGYTPADWTLFEMIRNWQLHSLHETGCISWFHDRADFSAFYNYLLKLVETRVIPLPTHGWTVIIQTK